MPDARGWLTPAWPHGAGTVQHECGAFVPQTPSSVREHERACAREQRDALKRAERERRRAQTETLRAINRERALERRVLGEKTS